LRRLALRRPTLRQVGELGLAFLIALVGVVGIIFFFEARDQSRVDTQDVGMGQPYRGEPPLSPALRRAVARGNVVVLYRDPRPPAGVRDLTGGAGPELRRVGLAVLLDRNRRLDAPLVAVSSTKFERARSAEALNPFVDRYLGRVPRK
jgi:hypothetical protein